MAWTNSRVFRSFVANVLLENATTGYGGLDADSVKAVLYDDSITPVQDTTLATSAYTGAGAVWTATEPPQQFDAAGWPAGGLALATPTVTTPAAGTTMYDAADRASTANVTITAAVGVYLFDDTITAPTADPGVSYNWFGGPASVTAGTFTAVFHANGIFRIA